MATGSVGTQASTARQDVLSRGTDETTAVGTGGALFEGGQDPGADVDRGTSSDDPRAIHPGIRAQLGGAAPPADAQTHLRRGDSGPEVGALRRDLQALGYLTREQTSNVFGQRMERAVEAFQRDLGIRPTGVAGPILMGAMNDVIDRIGVNINADSGHVVRDAQAQLERLGYFDGSPLGDERGQYGPRTERAIERFQRDSDLPITGRLGIRTFNALNRDGINHYREGDRNPAIAEVKRDLQALGYLTRSDDSSLFGQRMERAVEAFQRDLGISATGVAGPILREAMQDVINRIGVNRNADSEHVVRDAQSQLYRLGYFDERPLGAEKGEFGPRTERAIERFQRDNDLPVTGRLGIGTFRELNRDGIDHYRDGDRNPNIPEVKRDLQALGYLSRSDDSSLFGQRMERALRAFQRDVGIPATGVAGPTTTGNLNALANGVGIGRTERGEAAEAIEQIQSRLFQLGYFDGRPLGNEKGDFGPRTQAAVERFQRDHDLPVTGRVGAGTFGELIDARRGGDFVKPVDYALSVGSAFTYVDAEGAPDNNGVRHHAAKDWFAPGGTTVRSPVDGRIIEVTPSRGNSGQIYGGVVKVQAEDGKVWVFRHVDPGNVRVGQRVDAGDRLAGVTNWTDGSDHVHIELWKTLGGGYDYENMIDPMRYLGRFL